MRVSLGCECKGIFYQKWAGWMKLWGKGSQNYKKRKFSIIKTAYSLAKIFIDAMDLWLKGFLAQSLFDAKALWCKSSLVHKLFGAQALWRKRTLAQKLLGADAPGSLAQRLSTAKKIWYKCSSKALWRKGI